MQYITRPVISVSQWFSLMVLLKDCNGSSSGLNDSNLITMTGVAVQSALISAV